jgi:hypothetical protein
VGRFFVITAAVALGACGLFPDLSTLEGSDASIDAPVVEASPSDASPTDVAIDVSAYADVRITCEERPCIGQIGEICCWFNNAQDTCVTADACAGFATLECYGTIQCLAVGKTACCATGGGTKTICTDAPSCTSGGGTILCDRDDAGTFGDPSDNTCPSGLACTGTTSFQGYGWRSCK